MLSTFELFQRFPNIGDSDLGHTARVVINLGELLPWEHWKWFRTFLNYYVVLKPEMGSMVFHRHTTLRSNNEKKSLFN